MNKKPKRILIFSLVYYPRFIGGAEVAVKEITDRISSKDFEFDMITLRLDSRLPKFERIGNINVHRIGWAFRQREPSDSLPWYLHLNKYAMLWTAFAKALSLNRIRKYDAIWSIMATYNSFAALFFKLTHPRIPFFLTLQEGDPIPYIKRRALLLYPLFKMIFTKADRISAISNYLASFARDMGAECPIEVVPNGVDVANFQIPTSKFQTNSNIEIPNNLEKRQVIRERLGFNKNNVVLITTSRLVVKNAVEDIINALKFLPEKVKLLIIGSGYLEKKLRLQAASCKLQARVNFLGFVPHSELPPYLWASDVFVRPALSEGMGNSFIEAMAAGLPVIATPIGGIPDFLFSPLPAELFLMLSQSPDRRTLFSNSHELENKENNKWKEKMTGVFCEPNNPKSIADAANLLIADSVLRNEIVRNASKMVSEKYDWNLIVQRMKEEVFENLP